MSTEDQKGSNRNEIDCPRAKTWMTPCIARDGATALADPPEPVCVGCGSEPRALLLDLAERYEAAGRYRDVEDPDECADLLTQLIAEYVAPEGRT